MSDPDDPQAWIEKAQGDFLCIENNLAAKQIPWDVVAFHAQQAGEKMLKAFLVSTGQTVIKTHDLTFLLNLCRSVAGGFPDLGEECRWLTRYAVQFRYPGEEMAVEETEARESIDAARKIETAVASMLPRS
jgi:HEPN domain-containing protein